jgi:energy-coupling factor transport system permease protein
MAITDITLGQYYPGDSPIHRLDPRVKLLLVVAYIVIVFMVRGFLGFALVCIFVLTAAKIAGVPLRYLIKSIKPLLFIVVLTFILNVFFNKGGRVLASWWVFTITLDGLVNAAMLSLRLIFWVTGTSLLTLTTSPISLTDAIERLFKPLKVVRFPVHELAMMMTIALRFIPILLEETDKIMKAQMARGADFESGNLFARAKAMVPLLVPLFVSAFRRADELAMAMESRCYHGGEGRTRMKVLHMNAMDAVAALVVVAFGALALLDGRLFTLL